MPECSADVITESDIPTCVCYAPFVFWTLAEFLGCYASIHSEGIKLRNRFGIRFARFVNFDVVNVNSNRWLFVTFTYEAREEKKRYFHWPIMAFFSVQYYFSDVFVRIVIVCFCSHFRKLPPFFSRLCSLSVEHIFRKSTSNTFNIFVVCFDCKQNVFTIFFRISHTCFDQFFIFDDSLSTDKTRSCFGIKCEFFVQNCHFISSNQYGSYMLSCAVLRNAT